MTEKNSILCPNCRRLISRDEPVCPYCLMDRPGARWKRGIPGGFPLFQADPVRAIIAANAAFFLFSLLLNPAGLGLSANPMHFLSPSGESLFLLGATGTLPVGAYGRWWTLITASFLHGGLLHIFFNMMALRQLAPFVIEEFGLHRFVILYIWTGAAGFILSNIAGIPFTIGASASICGLIGAILFYGKSRGGRYGEAIYRQAMGWVAGLVLFGLFFPGINNWAHGGGLVSGIGIAFLAGYRERVPEAFAHRILGAATFWIAAATLLWTLVQAVYFLL